MIDENYLLYVQRKAIYDYIKLHENTLPDYWQDKGTAVCIHGICCMLARDKYSDFEIAEIYGCPLPLIAEIRLAYRVTIKKLREEHEDMLSTFGDKYTNYKKDGNDDGYIALLAMIFRRKYTDD